MATTCPLPDASKVHEILGMLFDGMNVKAGAKADLGPATGAWLGLFVDDANKPVALCATDLALSAAYSAALSMLPPGAAQDAVKSKDLSEVMRGNLQEIMNICSRLLMNDTSPHLRLEKVYPAKSLPAPASELLKSAAGRTDFEVKLPKYGGGILSLLSV
jgi:hypothetical protein